MVVAKGLPLRRIGNSCNIRGNPGFAQVTFMVGPESEKVDVHHISAGSLDLTLFTHSFLGLGQDSAQQEGLQAAKAKLEDESEVGQNCSS